MIDLYCERTASGLWAEPLNLWTNLAFILSALLIARQYSIKKMPRIYWVLPTLLFTIGLGSFAFHLHPIKATLLMDVIPISLFSISAIMLIQKDLFGFALKWNIVSIVIFIALSFIADTLLRIPLMNGSEGYLANWVYLALFAAALYCNKSPSAGWMGFAFVTFTLSLSLRTVDQTFCAHWPHGTHFFWHLLNAVGLWAICTAIAQAKRQPGQRE